MPVITTDTAPTDTASTDTASTSTASISTTSKSTATTSAVPADTASVITPLLIEQMTQWRRHIHSLPECGFDVVHTAAFIADKLESFGIEVVRDIGKSGVVGILRCGDGTASIGLRADMDALHIQEQNTFEYRSQHQGVMHACGHDGHSAMLLGAASSLAASRSFEGTVYFIFQPDEEHGKGAQAMIDDGLFERFQIDAVYGLHNLPGLPAGVFSIRPGSLMASESSFEIVLKGGGGHAAMPHVNADPLIAGAQVVLAIQAIVARQLSAIDEPAVISVTEFVTNGTVNVIPSQVTIKGDCRCFTEAALDKIKAGLERVVSGICQAADIEYDFELINSFYALINSEIETQHAVNAASTALGEHNVISSCEPLTISEDFSSMLKVKPGCYALMGNGTKSVGGCALHNPHYDFNDHVLEKGVAYWIQLTHDQLKK
jgi:hippurate hydrolase